MTYDNNVQLLLQRNKKMYLYITFKKKKYLEISVHYKNCKRCKNRYQTQKEMLGNQSSNAVQMEQRNMTENGKQSHK